MKQVLITFFLFLTVSSLQAQEYKYHNLSAEDFYIKMNLSNDDLLLDVRLFTEYRKKRIKNSIYAGTKDELIRIIKNIDKEIPILVYCTMGKRSVTVCKILINEFDFKNVYNLQNGLQNWLKQDYPIDKSRIKRNISISKT
ncbi:MAG: rhodanese-like domain-containing protein [Bacteroidales bacterium]|jgi:rhodanese-related sulfurtransferase|nr:rhodanese-like domain-containing protein [Bacteroidales bacterium]